MSLFPKYFLLLSLFLVFGNVFAQSEGDFPPVPSPPRLVNDFAEVLSSSERNRLEQKLVAYADSTSNQVSIVLIKSIGPYDISDYTFQLGDRWGIGTKEKENGVLILAAMEDRKVFIATGYGLEGAIPDVMARRIVDQVIVPNFRMEGYYQGLDKATDMIIKLAAGEYQADRAQRQGNSGGAIFFFLFFLFLFVILPMIRNKSDNNNHMGGRGGGVDVFTTLMLMNMLGGGRSRGKYGDFSSGRGSFGGGSFGGGGGFGGFGGGSFGGGGAGGSW
ncbi:TPM domain-containing protein [Litoribacter ruber]|uniref:TPM domain-containing protein n=1 Tax=Litoribacter ruber TaxID=702568 RepID=A0AAP2CGT3_9BACT|nr:MULTISPECIES: TPM domain-containing protein [Litoribacter]MBS9523510.1 TPM domain-containing protein [Litoribacter alkaliphilus]MBT0812073.1 TPM domain-containing protein [Litoribacter ruber]